MAAEIDCDGDGVTETSCDLDGDGIDDFVGGTDCDDTSAALSSADLDGDGFSACDGDCNEDTTLDEFGMMIGSYTYPASLLTMSPTRCVSPTSMVMVTQDLVLLVATLIL